MSPRPDSEVDTLDEAINNFQEIATIFKGESATGIYQQDEKTSRTEQGHTRVPSKNFHFDHSKIPS